MGAVLVSAGGSYDYSESGRTHQAPGDVALLDTLPGWAVHVPGHPDEAERQIRAAAAGDGLAYIRLSTRSTLRAAGAGAGPVQRPAARDGRHGDRGRPAGR